MQSLRLIAACALAMLLPTAAMAQPHESAARSPAVRTGAGFGVRAGYTDWGSLSQVHVGAHLKLGEVFPNVQFTPSIEGGFGDGATLIVGNADLAYSFTEFVAYPWNLYGGGGLSLIYLDPDGTDSDTSLGLSAVLGLERTFANEHQALVEIRVGLMDSPDFKLTFGYTLF